MLVIPAIDIRGGRCVRLLRGDFDRETDYGDPLAQALAVVGAGLSWLHVIDLDGARVGEQRESAGRQIVGRIVSETGLRVQTGGGVRSLAAVHDRLTTLGCARVILGTAAVESPTLIGKAVELYGDDRIVVALDMRDGSVAVKGWVEKSEESTSALLEALIAAGARWFLVTDIERDGTLDGPNLALYENLLRAAPNARLIASGGIRNIDDLERLHDAGLPAAVIGRALYERQVSLRELKTFASAHPANDPHG